MMMSRPLGKRLLHNNAIEAGLAMGCSVVIGRSNGSIVAKAEDGYTSIQFLGNQMGGFTPSLIIADELKEANNIPTKQPNPVISMILRMRQSGFKHSDIDWAWARSQYDYCEQFITMDNFAKESR